MSPSLPELHFDDGFFRDPHGTTAPLLRAGARAARVPELGTVFFLRYAEVMEALLDRRFGAIGVRYYEQQGWCEGPYIDWVRRTVVFLDPPDHDRLRGMLSRAFTPRQVARVRPITWSGRRCAKPARAALHPQSASRPPCAERRGTGPGG